MLVQIPSSPLAPGIAPVSIHFRDAGSGRAVVFLHSGWGYKIYPFGRQSEALAGCHRIVSFDRSGYGGSSAVRDLPADFHRRAMLEMYAVLDALDLERPILWGHSDGAIIALLAALDMPERISGAIVEATHYFKRKPGSREFFELIAENPRSVGVGTTVLLADDHGERWADLIAMHSRAWLRIAEEASSPDEDFYGGRLADVNMPILVVHGARDPRTEPGELDRLRAALPGARFLVFDEGGHSPHSERATADAVTRAAREFIDDRA